MKSFRFKYSTLVWVLLSLVLALSLCGLVWNVFSIIEYAGLNTIKVLSASVLTALCLLLTIVSVSIMLYGKYVIKGDTLYTYFGIIRSKLEISKITQIIHFKKSDKLVAYFNQKDFIIILIAPAFYDAFTLALREVNKAIIYDNKIEGEDTPN